jgi:alpha-L-rhamnosidase
LSITTLTLLATLLLAPLVSLQAADAVNLRCEYLKDPLGIDAAKPRLSWVMDAPQSQVTRNVKQTAYQVLVASTPELLAKDKGDLWESGKKVSDQSGLIEYEGTLLKSSDACHWKVRVWDQAGTVSDWSEPAVWTMGILRPEDWSAKWISTEMGELIKPSKNGGVLKILKATYTAEKNGGSADVTENVSSLVKDGTLDFTINAKTLGVDLAPKLNKNLVIDYELNGVSGSATVSDLRRVIIPAPDGTIPQDFDAPYVRKTFTLDAVPSSAIATINVMGFYELYVNGKKVGPNLMGPALSTYTKRSLYETYDLTSYLHKGENSIGLWLSRGWYWKGRDPIIQHTTAIARVQLDVKANGKLIRIGTDGSWKCLASGRSILGEWKHGNFGGERVDSRLEVPQWAGPTLDDSTWFTVKETSAPKILSDAQKLPAMRALKTLSAVKCEDLGKGIYRIDFGANVTGGMKLRLRGLKAGQTVTMQYSETLKDAMSYRQHDQFISAGKPEEEFCSKFNYHGFRWVTIAGLAQAPQLADAEAELIGTDFKTAGSFESSSDLLNRMHAVNLYSIQNLSQSGFLSDCPHRERLGYGDGQVSIESCIMNFEMQPFYDKWVTDWFDKADPATGYLPHVAPTLYKAGGGPAWGGAGQAITWRTYFHYGDKRILEKNLVACGRHIEAIESHATNGVVRAWGGKWDFIGDWVPPERGMDSKNWPPQPAAEFFNNCFLIYLKEQWAQMADVLGRNDEAAASRAEVQRLRPLIHAAFYDSENQRYVLDEQSYYLMPLMTGVVPEELRPTILKNLENCIRVTRKGHLDTGMLGTYFLINYLMEIGRNDLLWLIVTQEDYPGWGHMLKQGATTWWEQWNGHASQIHSCFTSLDGWFSQGLAGIRPDSTAPGFKKIMIKPAIVGDLTWVKCHYDSTFGRIISNWKREGGKLTMEVTIPANTTATVFVPARDAASVTESGKSANQATGLTFLRFENRMAAFEAGSGTYQFQSTFP